MHLRPFAIALACTGLIAAQIICHPARAQAAPSADAPSGTAPATGAPLITPKPADEIAMFRRFASPGEIAAVLDFIDFAGTMRHYRPQVARSFDDAARTDPPEMRELIRAAFSRVDENELTRRIGRAVQGKMRADYANQIIAFAATPTGQATARIFRESKTEESIAAAFKSLPPHQRDQGDAFMATPAMQDVLSLLRPEVQRESKAYGEEITCELLRGTRPELFAKVRAAGKCAALK